MPASTSVRSPRRVLLASGLVAFTPMVSHSFGRSTFGLLLPAIEDTLGLSHAQAGLGGTTIFAAYLVGVVAVAFLSTRVDPVWIMRGGVATAAAGLCWLSTVKSLGALLFGLFLAGGAGAGIWLTAPSILSRSVAARRRGLVIGLLTASTGLGTFVVGTATARARHWAGDDLLWRPVFAVEAAVAVTILIGLLLVVTRTPPRATAAGAAPATGPPTATVTGGARRRRLFDLERLRTVPAWRSVTAAYAMFGAAGAGFSSFLVRALRDDAGLSSGGASGVFAAMGLLAIPSAPTMGLLSDRVGRRPVLVGVLAMAGVGTIIVALGSGATAVVGAFCFGAVWSSFPTLVATYVRDHTDAHSLTEAFSTMTIFYSLAALVAPFGVGWLADRTGSFRASYAVLTALCATGTTLLVVTPRDRT